MRSHQDLIQILVDTFRPRDWSDRSMAGYLIAVEDLSLEDLTVRVKFILQNNKFMPAPAELLGNDEQFTTQEVFEKAITLLHSPSSRESDDRLTVLACDVVKRLGGWKQFGLTAPDPVMAPHSHVITYLKRVEEAINVYATKKPAVSRNALESGQKVLEGEVV